MTEVTGRLKESADGLRGRAASTLAEEAERRKLEAQAQAREAQKRAPEYEPEVGHTTSHGW